MRIFKPKEHQRRKELEHSLKLASALRSIGFDEKAKNAEACGRFYNVYTCQKCGAQTELAIFHCDDRLCVRCSRCRTATLIESYHGALSSIPSPKMLTLSMRSLPARDFGKGERGQLQDAMKKLWSAFRRLRGRKLWKRYVSGAIACLEITFNPEERTWHPHLHIVIDSDYIPWAAIKTAWIEATGGEGSAVDIRKCEPGWEHELIKYITKPAQIMADAQILREFIKATRGKRFVRTYGSLYNAKAEKEETDGEVICETCGVPMVLEHRAVPIEVLLAGTVGEINSLDAQRVWKGG